MKASMTYVKEMKIILFILLLMLSVGKVMSQPQELPEDRYKRISIQGDLDSASFRLSLFNDNYDFADLRACIDYYEKVLKEDPDNKIASVKLAKIRKEYRNEIEVIESPQAVNMIKEADKFIAEQELLKGIGLYHKLFSEYPGSLMLRKSLIKKLSLIWANDMSNSEVADLFKKEIDNYYKIDKEDEFVNRMGLCISASSMFKTMINEPDKIEEFIKEFQDYPSMQKDINILQAGAFLRKGDKKGAIKYIERSIEENPDNVTQRFLLAELYFNLKQYDNAIEVLNEIRKMSKDSKTRQKVDEIEKKYNIRMTSQKKFDTDYKMLKLQREIAGIIDKEAKQRNFNQAKIILEELGNVQNDIKINPSNKNQQLIVLEEIKRKYSVALDKEQR